ncbi:MAG: alkaline phosphatase family protein, partial [Conexibacter sp.]|nr:alkaline phosphatase family protein [Conexibacter sp.]
ALAAAVAAQDRCYAYLYWDEIDAVGHAHGPSSPEFDDACLRALDAVYAAFFGPEAPALEDTTLVVTADHGQLDVSPDRLDLVDVLWPGLSSVLEAPPAGSARDLFLHVREDAVETTIAALSEALGDHATVHRSETLFTGAIGPRLRERLAPVCVLPAPGRTAWLASDGDQPHLHFRGDHGGRTPEESISFLGTLELS